MDSETAAKSFQDVIERSTDHAFAYYYLTKCQIKMNMNQEIIDKNFNKFIEIIRKNNEWKDYSKYFRLIE